MNRMNRRRRSMLAAAVALAVFPAAALAHSIVGTEYPTLAKARLSRHLVNGMPVSTLTPVGGGLFVACFDAENQSPFDARITSIGFDLPPGTAEGDFVLVDPDDFAVELDAYAGFSLSNDAGRVPGFQGTELDFALLTGRTFGGGRPNEGIRPHMRTTFCVKGPFPEGLLVETLLDYSYVRFQRVGDAGELGDVGRPL